MKISSAFAAVFALVAIPAFAERAYDLDKAISLAAKGLATQLPENTKVVVIDITAETPRASEYIVDELTLDLFGTKRLIIVDRKDLESVRGELSFQMSGEVSDESTQRLGSMLGAETLVTGSFEPLNGKYRLAVKAVKVETAEIQYLSSAYVSADSETEALFGRKTGMAAAATKVGHASKKVVGFSGRMICSAVNPLVGIGSFWQGDIRGGSRVAFWELVGVGAVAYGSYRNDNDQSGTLIMGTGYFVIGAAVVYSWVRPWVYNRSPEVTQVIDNLNISYMADTHQKKISVGYVYRY